MLTEQRLADLGEAQKSKVTGMVTRRLDSLVTHVTAKVWRCPPEPDM